MKGDRKAESMPFYFTVIKGHTSTPLFLRVLLHLALSFCYLFIYDLSKAYFHLHSYADDSAFFIITCLTPNTTIQGQTLQSA